MLHSLFYEYPWDTDVDYSRFIIKAMNRGYFEQNDETSAAHVIISQTECEQRLLHLKKFYWNRVLHKDPCNEEPTTHFKALLLGEATIIRKILTDKFANKNKRTDLTKVTSLIKNLSTGLPNTPEFKSLILALEFTLVLDQLKKKYSHFLKVQKDLSFQEKQDYLTEIGKLSARLSNISITISKSILKSQLSSTIDRLIDWAEVQRAKSLVSESSSSRSNITQKIKQRILSEFSWFPHSRL